MVNCVSKSQNEVVIKINKCSHGICKDCIFDQLKNKRDVMCLLCKSVVPKESIETIVVAFEYEEQLKKENAEILKKDEEYLKQLKRELEEEEKKRKFMSCLVCAEEVEIKDMITLPCDHRICRNCLKSQIEYILQSNKNINEFVCYRGKEGCIKDRRDKNPNVFIDTEYEKDQCKLVIENIIGSQKFADITFKEMIKISSNNIAECKKCKINIEYQNNNSKTYTCSQCSTMYCKSCHNKFHFGNCGFDDKLEILKRKINDSKGKPILFRACPYCAYIFEKDENCEHVNCPSNYGGCGKDWNFCCSSKRSPTIAHGQHYHRPNCWILIQDHRDTQNSRNTGQISSLDYIKKGRPNDKMERNCEECQKQGKLCDLPKDLFKGVFPPELLPNYFRPEEIQKLENDIDSD